MRFVAYVVDGGTMIGVEEGDDLVGLCRLDEFYAEPDRWRATAPAGARTPLADVRRVPPVPTVSKIFCLGLNYQAHIDEMAAPGRERPPAPNIFARWYASLSCHDDTIPVPGGEPGLDWECELGVVIGRTMTAVPAGEAMAGVLGYTAFNDISARTHQRLTPQWALGKNADGSGAIGPHVVTADEFGDPYGRSIETRVNGEVMQSSTTDRMLFRIDETIAFISQVVTLRPGDVIATGTPEGVGAGRTPPVFMTDGDVCEVRIEGIAPLRTRVGSGFGWAAARPGA